MATHSSFAGVFRKIERAVSTSTTQSLNKAMNQTKTKYAKDVSQELGLPSGRVKARAKIFSAKKGNKSVTMSVGTRVIFAAHDFKARKQAVDTRLGVRYGATIQIGKRPRTSLLGQSFLVKAKSGKKIVIERAGDARYPTKTTLVNVFTETVLSKVNELTAYASDKFKDIIRKQIDYNMNK